MIICDDDHPIIEMINLLKNHYASGKTSGSFKLCDDIGIIIPKNMLPYLKKIQMISMLIPIDLNFLFIAKCITIYDRGRLFCNDSVSYRDLDCDLVSDEIVNDVEKIAYEFGYHKIPIYCDEHLDDKLKELDTAWERTSQGIDSGANEGINIEMKIKYLYGLYPMMRVKNWKINISVIYQRLKYRILLNLSVILLRCGINFLTQKLAVLKEKMQIHLL